MRRVGMGANKTEASHEADALKAEIAALKAENKGLKAEIKKLKVKLEKGKAETEKDQETDPPKAEDGEK